MPCLTKPIAIPAWSSEPTVPFQNETGMSINPEHHTLQILHTL
ncbi:hypothetical protein CGRA01v4_02145 [Colletotrichum graminicola]|nr:hypothetical protein CGRA01v4_02145 [Colletotrichum graminicola]